MEEFQDLLDFYFATYGHTFTLRSVLGDAVLENKVKKMLENGEIITDEKLGISEYTKNPNLFV